MRIKTMIITGALFCFVCQLQAQSITPQVIPTQGSSAPDSSVGLTWTMGQPFSQTMSGGGIILTLGFQQPEVILPPVAPAAQTTCSDTAYTFNFSGITAGTGADEIEWTTNSSFDSSTIVSSPANISVTVNAGYKDTIWIRSRIAATGEVSSSVMMMVKVNPLPNNLIPTQQDTLVCPGSSSNIFIPTSQTGLRYDLMVNSAVISSGYGNDSTLTISTSAIDSNTTFIVLATDTTTSCQLQLTPYLTIYTYKIGIPTGAAPQAVLSDTPYTFIFNVAVGVGGNQIVWALDSNFTNSYTDTSPAVIAVTLHPGNDTLIWLKSRDSVSGCTSYTSITIAIMNTGQFAIDTTQYIIQAICAGNATIATVPNSLPGVIYKLRLSSAVVDSSLGNDSTLIINTSAIDTNTAFNIVGIDTSSHSIVYMDTSIYIVALAPVDTPVFITGDTLIYAYDTAWAPYYAYAANSTQTIYSITSGAATIDSLTGQLYSFSNDSFTIKVTACGLPGCDTTTAYLHVNVADIAAPVAPTPIRVAVDSPQVVTITFDSIYAGSGGADEIEWAFNAAFTSSTIVASPATISFSLQTGADTMVYIRSRLSAAAAETKEDEDEAVGTGVSRGASTSASVNLQLLTAALLDKTNWVYNNWSDEFEYNLNNKSPLPYDNPTFGGKWSLASCMGFPRSAVAREYGITGGSGTCIATPGCEHIVDNGNESYMLDVDGFMLEEGICPTCKPGGHGEVTFANGLVDLKSRYPDVNCTGCYASFTYNENTQCDASVYNMASAGMLYSNITMDLSVPGMLEMRAQLPANNYESLVPYFALWNNNVPACSNADVNPNSDGITSPNGYNELDVIDGTLTQNATQYYGSSVRGGDIRWDCNTMTYCGGINPADRYVIQKVTPCAYPGDWHTWTAEWANKQIIYFLDGKEIWHHDYGAMYTAMGEPDWADNVMNPFANWIFYIEGLSYFSETNTYVDYMRYYTPTSTNTTSQCFQNLWDGTPFTLETPGPVGEPATFNNQRAYVTNNSTRTSSTIKPGCNIGVLELDPVEHNTQLYYNVTGALFTYNDVSQIEQRINAQYVYYMDTVNEHHQSGWKRYVVTATNDVQGFITPVSPNLIYYQNIYNGISCYQNIGGNSWWESRAYQSGDVFNAGEQVNFCAGYLTVDNQGRVWFKGTDNNLWCWSPNNGNLNQITKDGSVTGEVVMDPCGCLAFYNNTANHTLNQLWWWGTNPGDGFEKIAINPAVQVVQNSLALDDVNNRLYFIDNNNAVRYYTYQYSSANSNDPSYTTLGYLSTEANNSNNVVNCDSINNAASCLTLSYDKNTIYYIGVDNNIWYYFNDHDPFTANASMAPAGNWNKTALNHNVPVQGPLAVEPVAALGTLFYVGSNSKLYQVDWTPADNVMPSQICDAGSGVYQEVKMGADSNNTFKPGTGSAIEVTVFPNPSENTFTIGINNLSGSSNLELRIEDLSGRPVYINNSQPTDASSNYQLVWDASLVNSGLYIYQLKINGKTYSGKIVKL